MVASVGVVGSHRETDSLTQRSADTWAGGPHISGGAACQRAPDPSHRDDLPLRLLRCYFVLELFVLYHRYMSSGITIYVRLGSTY
jgi:hypothetical protein